MPDILVIDDNLDILSANAEYLTGHGLDVTVADTGVKAVAFLYQKHFDCIVLDILLPDFDGFTLCKAIRTITDAPIIFLTCLDGLDDKVKGLMMGGDDYMTKPYSLEELAARIYALLRRGKRAVEESADFYIDHMHRMIHTPEKNVFLSHKEFALFLLLYENPDVVFSKEELFKRIWKKSADVRTVAVHILKLRRKLEHLKPYIGSIENDYGTGYRMARPKEGKAV